MVTSRQLRFSAALGEFKKYLLKDANVPGEMQTAAVLAAVSALNTHVGMPEKTWKSWFSNNLPIPQRSSIDALNAIAMAVGEGVRRRTDQNVDGWSEESFSELARGGLLPTLCARTKADTVKSVLILRALDYSAPSPIHLHFDAIETSERAEGFLNLPWTTVKSIAAEFILAALAERWNCRDGTLYAAFRSREKRRWDVASDEERQVTRAATAKFVPDIFSRLMANGCWPDWSVVGVSLDTPVYQVLFSLAADETFLVDEIVDVWALDLATAALALYSEAWCDRYNTFGARVSKESIFWAAFYQIFFRPDDEVFDDYFIRIAMSMCDSRWSDRVIDMYSRARISYITQLNNLGVSVDKVFQVVMAGPEQTPLVYS